MKTAEININELFDLERILSEMQKQKGHGVGYEINFNLHKVREAKKDWVNRVSEFKLEKTIKGEDEKALIFLVDSKGLEIEKNGKPLILLQGKEEDEKYSYTDKAPEGATGLTKFYTDELEEVKAQLSKFEAELFTLKLLPFTEKNLKEAFKNNSLEGVDITPLFDHLIS